MNKKTVLITGASSGIGAEYAKQFGQQGYNLHLVARREKILKEMCHKFIDTYNIKAEYTIVDLSDKKQIEEFEKKIINMKDLEILINNAGFGIKESFIKSDENYQEAMINVHNIAPMKFCKAAWEVMKSHKKGIIINVSSLAGLIPSGHNPVYCGTKAFLVKFSQSLDLGCGTEFIKIQALCPGLTKTGFHIAAGRLDLLKKKFLFMSVEDVVKYSLKSLGKRSVICIPGRKNKLAVCIYRSLPHTLVARFLQCTEE